MEEILFLFKGKEISVVCRKEELMKNICERFASEVGIINNDCIYFVYLEGKLNKKLTLYEQVESLHKDNNKINILVYEKTDTSLKNMNNRNNKLKTSKCPKCGQNCRIKIKDYKITLYDCKNSHKSEDILLEEYKNIRNSSQSNIECKNCGQEPKNNEAYKCLTCGQTLCNLCHWLHDKKHNIVDYKETDFICDKHNDYYCSYCNDCKYNLCNLCIKEHNNHNIIEYQKIMPNKEKLKEDKEKMDNFKKKVNKVNSKIRNITKKINKVVENLETYYKINNDILNSYEIKNCNYQKLKNIVGIKDNFIKNDDLEKIINESDIINSLNFLLRLASDC